MSAAHEIGARGRAGPSGPVRILQLTDTHFPHSPGGLMQGVDTVARFDQVAAAIAASGQKFDLLLLTGDLVHEPSSAAYALLQTHLLANWPETPCYCLPGNHDDPTIMASSLAAPTVHLQAALEFSHWRMVFLNSRIAGSDGGFLDERQFLRLEQEIAREPRKHLLVAVHHHPLPCGSRWMDTMVITNGSRLLERLAASANQRRAVVFGHIHQVFDRTIGDVRLLGSPATCVQFKPRTESFALDELPPGYRSITLHADGSIETDVHYCA